MQAEAGASLSSATTPDHPRTPRGASTRHLAVLGLAAATAYGIDQATKAWALDALADGHPVVLTGSAAERERAAAIAEAAELPGTANLAGRTDLGELAALVAGVRTAHVRR